MDNIKKKCTDCGEEKLLDEFAKKSRDGPNGRQPKCKVCQRLYQQKYYPENKARHNELTKAWYLKNIDRHRELMAKWRAENGEKIKLDNAAYSEKNKEKIRIYSKEWRAANPEMYKAQWLSRRARLINAPGSHTGDDIAAILALQKYKCAVCRCDVSIGYHVDHVQPLSRGGSNDKSNLQILCATCNLQKGAKDPVKFMNEKGLLL